MKITTVATAATTISAALVLAACGTNDTAAPPPATTPTASSAPAATTAQHNDADITFVQDMIPHHSQAVQMAQLAPRRARGERVGQLATRIERAQGPEIAQMRGLLAAWDAPESGGMPGTAGGTNHEAMGRDDMGADMGGDTGGMASGRQLQQLDRARGPEFDRLFLQMMLAHHQGAVQMARTELAAGSNPDARGLARRVIDTQQAEISEMNRLLAS